MYGCACVYIYICPCSTAFMQISLCVFNVCVWSGVVLYVCVLSISILITHEAKNRPTRGTVRSRVCSSARRDAYCHMSLLGPLTASYCFLVAYLFLA